MNNTFSNAVTLSAINSFRSTLYIVTMFLLDRELYDIYNKDLYCSHGDFVYSKFVGATKMTITLKDFSVHDNTLSYSGGTITVSGEDGSLDIVFDYSGYCDAISYSDGGVSYIKNSYLKVIDFVKQYIEWNKFDRGFLMERLREFVTQYGFILQFTNMRC